jgi:hypothetical protein
VNTLAGGFQSPLRSRVRAFLRGGRHFQVVPIRVRRFFSSSVVLGASSNMPCYRSGMRGLSWTFAGLVGLTLVLVALVVLGIWQPDIAGRWCPERAHWLVCYRDWLVPLSGWAVAAAAASFIAHERIKARQTKEQIVRAARLRIGFQLQELISACNKVVSEVELFRTTAGQRGKPHMSLPQPRFVEETAELSFLPAQEADAIAWLAQEIMHTNARVELERDLAEADQDYLTGLIEAKGAQIVLHALIWRDRMAREIGWNPMRFDEDRKKRLGEIVSNKLFVYERLEQPDAAIPV